MQKTTIKISNMNMKILINKNNKFSSAKGSIMDPYKIKSEIIPSFTKKLFSVASSK